MAVAVCRRVADAQIIQPPNPNDIEATWVLLRPKFQKSVRILVGGVYVSGTEKYKPPTGAVDKHLSSVVEFYNKRHKHLLVVVAGDFNREKGEALEAADIEQIVKEPTRGNNILDLIFTNMDLLENVEVLSPLDADDPNRKEASGSQNPEGSLAHPED